MPTVLRQHYLSARPPVNVPVTGETVPSRHLAHQLVEVRTDHFDLWKGILGAAMVLTPLAIGYALGLVEASVLITLGALNLFFAEAPFPAPTPWRTVAVGAVSNAVAFGAGTLLGQAPFSVEVPLVAVGVLLAFLLTRWSEWENVGFIAAVMFVLAVGIPATTLAGDSLRPLAVLVGGLWALLGLTIYRVVSLRGRPGPAPAALPTIRRAPIAWRSEVPHAVVVGGVVAVGLVVGSQLGLARDYWIMLTIIVALRSDLATTISYSVARIVGTVAGAAVAFVVTDATNDPWLLFPLLALAAAICLATRSVNYTLYAVWVTLTVIVLLNIAYSGGPSIALTRVVDTVLGGALALIAAFVLWSTVHRAGAPRGSFG